MHSSPESTGRLAPVTAKGTIVGFPAVIPVAHQPELSAYSEALEPGRWSNPPPSGVSPIIPCEEPDDEDVAVVMPSPVRLWAPIEPVVAASSLPVVDDPVILPMRGRDVAERGFRRAAFVVVSVMLVAAVLIRFLL